MCIVCLLYTSVYKRQVFTSVHSTVVFDLYHRGNVLAMLKRPPSAKSRLPRTSFSTSRFTPTRDPSGAPTYRSVARYFESGDDPPPSMVCS